MHVMGSILVSPVILYLACYNWSLCVCWPLGLCLQRCVFVFCYCVGVRMVWIYVLELAGGKYYVGKSKNLQYRIAQHFNGKGCEWCEFNI
jgi:GIY-YIG catalytic domain